MNDRLQGTAGAPTSEQVMGVFYLAWYSLGYKEDANLSNEVVRWFQMQSIYLGNELIKKINITCSYDNTLI
jgi:hypothetical protein